MGIDWIPLAGDPKGKPFSGDLVLLACPNSLASGRQDPDFPFTYHLGQWDAEELMWATKEGDDETGGILWLKADMPTHYAEVDAPI